jgi:hypothetical protein
MSLEPPPTIQDEAPHAISVPSPTAWPIALALGITLLLAGMVTTAPISILGAILTVTGYVGWFRDVLPHEKHELVRASVDAPSVGTSRRVVARVGWITHEPHRARLPLEVYPVSSGIKGGLAGSVAMAVLAVGYGLIVQHSLWYPINLLAAGFFPGANNTTEQLASFQPTMLIIATIIHLVTSLLVGLLYGAMLPMFPRRPILFGGLIAPVMWSGLIYSVVEFINPVLGKRINWPWFVVSQLGFGVVAGIVVSKQQRVRTWQHLPFEVRAGFEAPGAMGKSEGEDVPG